jgi:peptidoglycan-N-acetylglucosamine deacetylase
LREAPAWHRARQLRGKDMRLLVGWICAAAALLLQAPVAWAEQSCPKDALGVSRTIEVDTTGGPWFGEPHGDRDFLAPGEVVLTFDDGPAPRSTRAILAALAAQCTKATFFVLGERAAEYPADVRETMAQGHTIGTHTWSHLNIKRLSEEQAKSQIETAFTEAEKAAGKPVAPFFRYPYLSDNPAMVAYLQSRNIGQFAIDVDSFDWRSRNAKAVIHRVMASLERRGRGIILFHDIHWSTAQAIPELLALLKAKGYKVVHLQPKATLVALAEYQGPPTAAKPATTARRQGPVRRARHRVSQWPGW